MTEAVSTKVSARARTVPQEWLNQNREEALEPDLPIIDPHHHLWDFPMSRYQLNEVLADAGDGHNVRKTVFIECTSQWRADGPEEMQPVGETEYANGIAAMSASGDYGDCRIAAGIVGYADLRLGGAVEDVLQAHVNAGGGRFRGTRHSISFDPSPAIHNSHVGALPDMYHDPAFQDGFRTLGRMGLSFEAWLYHPQLDELAFLVEAFPDNAIVLNHVGGPLGVGPYEGRQKELFPAWKAGVEKVAAAGENVCVKLGGLGMPVNGFGFQDRASPPSSQELADTWRPYVETCIEAFGPNRCMFESNFPVDKVSGSYRTYWNAFKRLASGANDAEKAAMFHDVAAKFYKI